MNIYKERALKYIFTSLYYQRASGYVARAHGAVLSHSEKHLLGEINAWSGRKISEYAERLCFDQSTVLRIANRLLKARLISLNFSGSGYKTFRITPKGLELINQDDLRSSEKVKNYQANLQSVEEVSELTKFIKIINDQIAAPPSSVFLHDNPLRLEIRRQTRIFGILGTKYLRSEFTNSQAEVFAIIEEAGGIAPVSAIVNVFNSDQSSVSRILGNLKDKKLLIESVNSEDKRQKNLSFTKSGLHKWEKAKDDMTTFLAPAFEKMTEKEFETGLRLLSRYAGRKEGDKFLKPPFKTVTIDIHKITRTELSEILNKDSFAMAADDKEFTAIFRNKVLETVTKESGDVIFKRSSKISQNLLALID